MNDSYPQILIVDDEPLVLKSLREILALHGHEAHTSNSGHETLEQLGRHEYDLLLLDLNMPDIDGHEIMAVVHEKHPNTSVIVVSGEATFDAAKKACQHGAYDFLRKPYQTDELLITINNALKERELKRDNININARLMESEKLHRYIVNTSPDIVYMLDQKGHFTFVNARIESLLGYHRDELIGKSYTQIVHTEDIEQAHYAFNERRVGERATRNVEIRLKCKNTHEGSRFFSTHTLPIELNSMGIYASKHDETREVYVGTYGVARDITERKEAEETITYQAYHDLLTNLPNRALLKDRLGLAISQAKREDETLAVLFLDLDRFKNVNDTLGHVVGDQLLQSVSTRLKSAVREGDTLARFGGDEFTLLLPKIHNSTEDIRAIAQKIIELLKEPFNIEGHELFVSASIGISLFPKDGVTMDNLIKNADIAMYSIKGQSKNGYAFYSNEMQTPYFHNLSLESGIRNALSKDQFSVVYQPQVNITSGKVVGVEALIRWKHPEKGYIPPDDFIPYAEETGLIVEIGEWVMNKVCQDIRLWRDEELPEVRFSVNLSSRQLAEKNITEKILGILERHGIDGSALEIEITENLIMQDMESVIQKLGRLNNQGVRIAIDDFGTGYSSLGYIQKLPINTLKIDRVFLKDIRHTNDSSSIIKAIVSMAKGLNMNIIAEGVEIGAQLAYLRSLDCTEAQGYIFGKPLDSDTMMQLLCQKPFKINDLAGNVALHKAKPRQQNVPM